MSIAAFVTNILDQAVTSLSAEGNLLDKNLLFAIFSNR